jgi:hypothetical protein
MRNRIEVFGEIPIDHVGVAPAYKPVRFLDSVGWVDNHRHYPRDPPRRLAQNQLRGCFHHAITDCGYTKRAFTGSSWLVLRPVGMLDRSRRSLSRGFDSDSCPSAPLVSYQTYRHLSGWILPPLVIRIVEAHKNST